MHRRIEISLLVLGILIGWGLNEAFFLEDPIKRVNCRPSQPQKVPHHEAALFWGNSLAFDHDWTLEDTFVVNCAQQGMTAQDAVGLLPNLPQMPFKTVVLVFGTVELLHETSDLERFRLSLNAIVEHIKHQAPAASIVALGVPSDTASLGTWSYTDTVTNIGTVKEFNRVLMSLEGVRFLDTTAILEDIPAPNRTYDGVHLSDTSYDAIQAALIKTVSPL